MSFIAPGLRSVGAVLLALGLAIDPAHGVEPALCDCSCTSYQELINLVDNSPALAASTIDQCGAGCAIAWGRCETSEPVEPNGLVPPDVSPNVRQALVELLERFLAGASSGDVAMHDRFWSEELVYTSSAGQRYGKAELMAGLIAGPADADPAPVYSAEQIHIRVYDQLALIDFILVATDANDDQQHFLNSGVLKREDGQWRAVNWQATRKAAE